MLVFACLTVWCSVWVVLASGARLSPMSWTPPAAESLRADGLLASRFAGGEPHLVLLTTASGSVDDARSARAGRVLVESLAADPRTAWVRGYWPTRLPGFRTPDGHRALVLVRFRGDEHAVRTEGDDTIARHTGWAGAGKALRVSAGGETAVHSRASGSANAACGWPSPWRCR